jgi:hypothetical protein
VCAVDALCISSTNGFHSRTRALMNQLNTCPLDKPRAYLASITFSESFGYLIDSWRFS